MSGERAIVAALRYQLEATGDTQPLATSTDLASVAFPTR
jgi:hypothetical protein